MDRQAIQKAIDAAYENGGGTVIVPAPGKYRIGTIRLKDNVTFTNCVLQTTFVALKLGKTVKDMSDITSSNCVIT